MINYNGEWLPSVMPWAYIIATITALLVLTLIWLWVRARSRENEDFVDTFWLPGSFVLIVLTLLVGISIVGYWPFKADYHRLQPATGIVKEVDTRFLAASQYVVITYDTGLIVRCDDSRCATVEVGDQLRLLCTKEHEFGSPLQNDGWGCRWGQP